MGFVRILTVATRRKYLLSTPQRNANRNSKIIVKPKDKTNASMTHIWTFHLLMYIIMTGEMNAPAENSIFPDIMDV